jgi:hypothetical protein
MRLPQSETLPTNGLPNLVRTLQAIYRRIAEAVNRLAMYGTETERPSATGSGNVWYSTDTSTLYVDDGSWDAISAPVGNQNLECGNSDDIYLPNQNLDGGEASSVYSGGQVIDGGTA